MQNACITVILTFISVVWPGHVAVANDVVTFGYNGPAKTAFIIDQAKIVARSYKKRLTPDKSRPSVFVLSDENVFQKLKNSNYVQREFRNSPDLQRELAKEDYSGRVCVMLYGLATDLTRLSVIIVDAALDNKEIEACTLDMLQHAMRATDL